MDLGSIVFDISCLSNIPSAVWWFRINQSLTGNSYFIITTTFTSTENFSHLLQTRTGMVELEGCVCEEYYAVRRLLYSQFAIV